VSLSCRSLWLLAFPCCGSCGKSVGLSPTRRSITEPAEQLALDPLELASDVIDDVAGLQVLRQHVPRIRFDLEVRRQLVRLVELERILDREARRPEIAEVVEKDRNVDMRAPFARAGIALPRGERVLEIQILRELPVATLDGLRQIDRIRVLAERVDLLLRDLGHADGRGLLQLEHRDADVGELPQRRADILVFDGLVTDVVNHAEMLRERTLSVVSGKPGLLGE